MADVRDAAAARRVAAQANITDLRRQLGQLRLTHGHLIDGVWQQTDRKRVLVDEVAVLDRRRNSTRWTADQRCRDAPLLSSRRFASAPNTFYKGSGTGSPRQTTAGCTLHEYHNDGPGRCLRQMFSVKIDHLRWVTSVDVDRA